MLGQLLAPLFRDAPDVPAFRHIDANQVQRDTITGNTSALPQIENLAQLVNLFSQDEWDKALERAMPGYQGQKSVISKNILDLSEGKIPTDISDQVQNSAAVRALDSGYAGSGMHRDLVARDLGLTSLNVMQKGLDSMNTWLARTKAPTFDVSSMFFSPQQRLSFEVEERDKEFQHDWVGNQIKSQYDLGNQYADALVAIDAQIAQFASSLAGSAGGKMFG